MPFVSILSSRRMRMEASTHFLSPLYIHSLSGPSVADTVVGFLDETTLKQHAAPAGCCSPIVVVLCMTSDCVNVVAAALRSALPRALVGKMYVALPAFNAPAVRVLHASNSVSNCHNTFGMYSGGGGALVKREVQDQWLRGSGSAAHVLVATPVRSHDLMHVKAHFGAWLTLGLVLSAAITL